MGKIMQSEQQQRNKMMHESLTTLNRNRTFSIFIFMISFYFIFAFVCLFGLIETESREKSVKFEASLKIETQNK